MVVLFLFKNIFFCRPTVVVVIFTVGCILCSGRRRPKGGCVIVTVRRLVLTVCGFVCWRWQWWCSPRRWRPWWRCIHITVVVRLLLLLLRLLLSICWLFGSGIHLHARHSCLSTHTLQLPRRRRRCLQRRFPHIAHAELNLGFAPITPRSCSTGGIKRRIPHYHLHVGTRRRFRRLCAARAHPRRAQTSICCKGRVRGNDDVRI